MIKYKSILSILLLSFSVGCVKLTPSGFWVHFQSNFLKKNISDQGTWGGSRAMYWNANNQNTFTSKFILDYALKNGWTLLDSSEYTTSDIKNWQYIGESIFPLSLKGFDTVPCNDEMYKHFPRWINSDIKLFKFKTGWLTIDPGTDKSIEVNGFVIVNCNGTEMSVYHLWGE